MRAFILLAAASASMSSFGCVRLRLPDAPTTPTEDPDFAPAEIIEQPGLAEDPPVGLMLQPGDVISIRTFSGTNQEYTNLVVDDRGRVHVPLAGPVEVAAIPLEEAEARVQEALRSFDRVVRVSLVLTDAAGHAATVLGAVETPGRAVLRPGMRVVDLIAAAGGPILDTSTGEVAMLADLDGARLVRGGQAVPISVRLALEGDPRHNVRVQPGDHLYLPALRGTQITVLGHVTNPRLVPFRPGLRLTQVLAIAGGLTPEGDRSDIHVVRGPLSAPRVYGASLRDVVDGDASDVELAAGDIVFVTQEWTANTGEVLNRLSPLITVGVTGTITGLVARPR